MCKQRRAKPNAKFTAELILMYTPAAWLSGEVFGCVHNLLSLWLSCGLLGFAGPFAATGTTPDTFIDSLGPFSFVPCGCFAFTLSRSAARARWSR
jgi:hypothetical protein